MPQRYSAVFRLGFYLARVQVPPPPVDAFRPEARRVRRNAAYFVYLFRWRSTLAKIPPGPMPHLRSHFCFSRFPRCAPCLYNRQSHPERSAPSMRHQLQFALLFRRLSLGSGASTIAPRFNACFIVRGISPKSHFTLSHKTPGAHDTAPRSPRLYRRTWARHTQKAQWPRTYARGSSLALLKISTLQNL